MFLVVLAIKIAHVVFIVSLFSVKTITTVLHHHVTMCVRNIDSSLDRRMHAMLLIPQGNAIDVYIGFVVCY